MAIRIPTPTPEARQALTSGAALYTDNDGALARLLAQAPVGLHVFTITLDEAAANQWKSQPDAWRFLASDEDGTFISGEVSRAKDGRLKLTSVSRDPTAAAPFNAAKQIEHVSRIEAKSFRMSVLRIPGILMEALLLESEVDNEVLIVPVSAPSEELRRNVVNESGEFLGIIQPLLARFRAFDHYRLKPAGNA